MIFPNFTEYHAFWIRFPLSQDLMKIADEISRNIATFRALERTKLWLLYYRSAFEFLYWHQFSLKIIPWDPVDVMVWCQSGGQHIVWANGRPVWWGISNSSPPGQSGCHFADDMFKRIFLNENIGISNEVPLKCVPWGLINNMPALV